MCLAPEDSPQNSSAPRISAREWLAPLCRCWWFVVGIPPSGNSLRWWPSQNAEKTPQKQNPSPEAWGWIPARGIGQPIDRLYLLSINFYSLSMCWILRNKICVIKKSLAVPVSLSSLFLIWGQLGGTDSGAKFVRYFFGEKKKKSLKITMGIFRASFWGEKPFSKVTSFPELAYLPVFEQARKETFSK